MLGAPAEPEERRRATGNGFFRPPCDPDEEESNSQRSGASAAARGGHSSPTILVEMAVGDIVAAQEQGRPARLDNDDDDDADGEQDGFISLTVALPIVATSDHSAAGHPDANASVTDLSRVVASAGGPPVIEFDLGDETSGEYRRESLTVPRPNWEQPTRPSAQRSVTISASTARREGNRAGSGSSVVSSNTDAEMLPIDELATMRNSRNHSEHSGVHALMSSSGNIVGGGGGAAQLDRNFLIATIRDCLEKLEHGSGGPANRHIAPPSPSAASALPFRFGKSSADMPADLHHLQKHRRESGASEGGINGAPTNHAFDAVTPAGHRRPVNANRRTARSRSVALTGGASPVPPIDGLMAKVSPVGSFAGVDALSAASPANMTLQMEYAKAAAGGVGATPRGSQKPRRIRRHSATGVEASVAEDIARSGSFHGGPAADMDRPAASPTKPSSSHPEFGFDEPRNADGSPGNSNQGSAANGRQLRARAPSGAGNDAAFTLRKTMSDNALLLKRDASFSRAKTVAAPVSAATLRHRSSTTNSRTGLVNVDSEQELAAGASKSFAADAAGGGGGGGGEAGTSRSMSAQSKDESSRSRGNTPSAGGAIAGSKKQADAKKRLGHTDKQRTIQAADVAYVTATFTIYAIAIGGLVRNDQTPEFPFIAVIAAAYAVSAAWTVLRFFVQLRSGPWDIAAQLPDIRQYYLRSWFALDLFCCLPLDFIALSWNSEVFFWLQARQLARIPRLSSLTRSANPLKETRMGLLMYMLAMTAVFFIHAFAAGFSQIEDRYTYWDSLYWTMTTISSVGYGDITPSDHPGNRAFAGLVMIFGVAMISVMTALATAVFTSRDALDEAVRSRKAMLSSMLEYYRIPWQEQIEIIGLFPIALDKENEKGFTSLVENLPGFIVARIERYTRAKALADAIPLFSELPVDVVLDVTSKLQQHFATANEEIISKGDDGNEMFFLVRGVADVVIPVSETEDLVVASLRSGAFFGEMALLQNTTRTASVVTVVPCELLVLSKSDFQSLVAEHRILEQLFLDVIFARLELTSLTELRDKQAKQDAADPTSHTSSESDGDEGDDDNDDGELQTPAGGGGEPHQQHKSAADAVSRRRQTFGGAGHASVRSAAGPEDFRNPLAGFEGVMEPSSRAARRGGGGGGGNDDDHSSGRNIDSGPAVRGGTAAAAAKPTPYGSPAGGLGSTDAEPDSPAVAVVAGSAPHASASPARDDAPQRHTQQWRAEPDADRPLTSLF